MTMFDSVSEPGNNFNNLETGNNTSDGVNYSARQEGLQELITSSKPHSAVVMPNQPIELSSYQRFIALSRYARFLPDEERRESWEETVARYCNYMSSRHSEFPTQRMYDAIVNMRVMPSMRALMTAGKALDQDNVAAFNCAYVAVDDPKAFDEVCYILMCGTGVGFSVERQFIVNLPEVAEHFQKSDTVITVPDSRIGWAESLREIISLLYAGRIPSWDLSKLRPAGAPLKTFGGRSSGPAPLDDLFKFCVSMFKTAAGRRLTSIECHDLMCKIGDVVVSGGVRRSALISLSNLSDQRMAKAKSGQWWETTPHRMLANNSVAYTEKPDMAAFIDEWKNLYESKSGERGIFSRVMAKKKVASLGRRNPDFDFGTNPCAEILLRPGQFCNLTEVVIREDDTVEMLMEKVEIATILGTFQSTLTNFRYLRSMWRKSVEEERLLGVSLTGIMDNQLTNGLGLPKEELAAMLEKMKAHAVAINIEWAEKLGISASTAITTVKPSGTVSQLVNSASGIHGRFSRHYIRTVRNDKLDPLSDFLVQQGIPHEEDVMKAANWVFSYPMQSPVHARLADEMTALEQLEHYLLYNKHWSEHSISVTVYVRESEWLKVAAWVYEHFNEINGISFLPYSEHTYRQAPFQAISDLEYNTLIEAFPNVDFTEYRVNEHEDNTQGAKQLACVSGTCDII